MEKMLKRVGLCSGRRAMDSDNSDSKQNCSCEPSDSNTVYRLEKGSDNKYERKGDAVKDHPLCDVVNSNECFLQHRLAGVVDDSTGVIGGDLLLAEDVDGSDKTGEGIICGQIERRRCWRRSRVLFHFQLDSHIMEFKPRALTKRLCGGKKQDNELYRSNSFKFERFERKDVGPLQKQVEVIETYCDPRDSKAYLRPGEEPSGGKLYTSPDRDYSQPYPKAPSLAPNLTPDEKEIEAHLEEETVTTFVCPEVDDLAASLAAAWAARVAANEGVYEAVGEGVNEGQSSPTETSIQITGGDNDSISGEVQDQEGVSGGTGNQQVLQPNPPQRRHPSPYYYADLFRGAEKELELEEEEERDEEGYSNEADTHRPQKHHHHHHHHRHHHHRHHHHAHHSHHHHHRHRHRFSHLNNEEEVAEGEVNDRSKAGGVTQALLAGLKSFDAEKDPRPVDKEEEGSDVADDQQLLSFGRSVVEDTLLLRLLSESPSTVGPSLAEVEGIASEGGVIAETAAGGGRDPSGLGENTGGYGGGGGGGPAPAFLAACLLRDWDLIFATPAAVVTAAPRPSTTPGGAKSVAKGLRSCSCRGGRCVTSEEEEEEGEEEDGKAAAEVVGGECCDIATSNALLEEDEEMTGRQRHLYETAFDCKVRRSQDDLDEVDRVSNHPVLRMLPTALARAAAAAVSPRPSRSQAKEANSSTPPKERRKLTLTRGDHKQQSPSLGVHERLKLEDRTNSSSSSTKGNADLKIRDRSTDFLSFQTPPSVKGPLGSGHAPSPPPLRGYAPSPPSTAPLPTKFHNRSLQMNSIRSAPNLPAGGSGANCVPSPARMKDSRLPVKSSRGRHSVDGPILEFKGRPGEEDEMEEEEEEDERIEVQADLGCEGGERRTLVLGRPSRQQYRPNLPTVSAGARPKYSSTESMATSSSAMSSLESLRSSTSEGNRSTSSSGSRRSSSLSSHSSDSGSTRLLDLHRLHLHHLHHHHHHHHHQHHGSSQMLPQLGVMGHQGGHPQLHILSPISDKSQEPASETSDNNRNNNSQGASPEERLSSPIMVDNGTVVAATTNTNSLPAPSIPSNLPLSPPQPDAPSSPQTLLAPTPWEVAPKMKRRVLVLQNKNLLNRALVQAAAAAAAAATSSSGEAEVQGSDSGISIESSSQGQCSGQGGTTGGRIGIGDENRGLAILGHEELRALPFDMPKLRRRLAADASGSSSTSVASNSRPDDLRALPFDMPKLRRRLRQQQSTDGLEPDVSSGVSQASSSQSVLELDIHTQNSGKALVLGPVPGVIPQPQMSIVRPKLTLNLCGQTQGPSLPSAHPRKKRPGLSLELGCSALSAAGEPVDVTIPLERQGWYHGAITRVEAESVLRLTKEGSYLVRNSESTRQDYSLSLKSARGFMHMRIQQNKENRRFILGQFSQPFSSIPDMIHHYTINRLPIKGAEHMCLLHPVIEQLL